MEIKGVKVKEFFKPKNWFSWLRGTIIGSDLKQEYVEQVMFRMTNPNCKVCIEQGTCVHCGCNTFKKMLDPYAECSGRHGNGDPYWGQMLSKKQWKEYKDFVGLHFDTIYDRINEPDTGTHEIDVDPIISNQHWNEEDLVK